MSEADLTPIPGETAASTEARRLSRRQRKAIAWQGRNCQNCGAELRGPFCHVCGQPEKTPVRDLVSLSTDAFDYLFDVDSRLYKTLRDLFFRPGKLTQAYLTGQRMSFVRPMRIYLAMSALLFVVVSYTTDMQVNVDPKGDINIAGGVDARPPADSAPEQPAAVGAVPTAPAPPPAPSAADPTQPAPDTPASPRKPIELTFFGDKPWNRTENPLVFPNLPDWVNDRINDYIGQIKTNLDLARSDPKRLGHSFLRVLPQSLFVLLPIFALLLKCVLVFKRRLYMEHLMVAVHSHTFAYLGIVIAVGLSKVAENWPAGWTNPWYFLMGLSIAWLPLNLFLTQKRVYRQGWFGALCTYGIIGTLYVILFSFTALGALVMSLVNL